MSLPSIKNHRKMIRFFNFLRQKTITSASLLLLFGCAFVDAQTINYNGRDITLPLQVTENPKILKSLNPGSTKTNGFSKGIVLTLCFLMQENKGPYFAVWPSRLRIESAHKKWASFCPKDYT